ncbi:hypothetical protein PMAYCL1PPCAC_27105, partial [Pristionchus mayeri]
RVIFVCLLLLHVATAMGSLRDILGGSAHNLPKRDAISDSYRMRSCKAAEMAEKRLRGMDMRKMRIGKPSLINYHKFLQKYCSVFADA